MEAGGEIWFRCIYCTSVFQRRINSNDHQRKIHFNHGIQIQVSPSPNQSLEESRCPRCGREVNNLKDEPSDGQLDLQTKNLTIAATPQNCENSIKIIQLESDNAFDSPSLVTKVAENIERPDTLRKEFDGQSEEWNLDSTNSTIFKKSTESVQIEATLPKILCSQHDNTEISSPEEFSLTGEIVDTGTVESESQKLNDPMSLLEESTESKDNEKSMDTPVPVSKLIESSIKISEHEIENSTGTPTPEIKTLIDSPSEILMQADDLVEAQKMEEMVPQFENSESIMESDLDENVMEMGSPKINDIPVSSTLKKEGKIKKEKVPPHHCTRRSLRIIKKKEEETKTPKMEVPPKKSIKKFKLPPQESLKGPQPEDKKLKNIPVYKCHLWGCKKSFGSKVTLQAHVTSHNETIFCSYCQRDFSCQDKKDRHEIIHPGAKLYLCHVTGKSYSLLDTPTPHI